MFEEDTLKILPIFNSIEDFDTVPEEDEDLVEDEEVELQGSDTNQSATPARKLSPYDFQPHLGLLRDSRRVFLDIIGAEGERALEQNSNRDLSSLWGGLDLAIRKAPVVRLISSESFRKERSQVRILKTKSRLIRYMERFVTKPWN